MNSQRLARIFQRTPGEVAFDRCFFPLAALFVFGVVVAIVTLASAVSQTPKSHTEAQLSSGSADTTGFSWVMFAVGLVIAFFWCRAAISLIQAWRDPSARVLRFSCLGLLIPLAWIIIRLLLLPFAK